MPQVISVLIAQARSDWYQEANGSWKMHTKEEQGQVTAVQGIAHPGTYTAVNKLAVHMSKRMSTLSIRRSVTMSIHMFGRMTMQKSMQMCMRMSSQMSVVRVHVHAYVYVYSHTELQMRPAKTDGDEAAVIQKAPGACPPQARVHACTHSPASLGHRSKR